MNSAPITIYLLLGLYHQVWDVVFERLYHYHEGYPVVVLNPGALHSEKAYHLARSYGFSYVEMVPNNIEAAQNYLIQYIIDSPLVIKIDDDVFTSKNTIKNISKIYKQAKEEGVDVGFVTPVVNVNNVTYYHFLKTLNLLDEYTRHFEKPHLARDAKRQRIWYDPIVARWIWERSLPLNDISERFERANGNTYDLLPVRVSINCILFEKRLLIENLGFSSRGPILPGGFTVVPVRKGPLAITDEESINFYADVHKYGRIVALNTIVGHLAYNPQREAMLKWFSENRNRLLEDVRR